MQEDANFTKLWKMKTQKKNLKIYEFVQQKHSSINKNPI